MKWIITTLLATMLAVSAFAGTTPEKTPDARLDAKVSLNVTHAKLQDVLKTLTDETKVVIEAGSDERDWRVKDRRVTIHAKDISLKLLMDEISELLGYRLTRGGEEGKWSYLYWQDKQSRDLEGEMLIAEREEGVQRVRKLRQGSFDSAEQALRMTPAEAAKLKDTDPWTAYLGGTKSGRGMAQLLSYIGTKMPAERDLMLRGKRVAVPLSNLPQSMQQAVSDTLSGGFSSAVKSQMNGFGDFIQPNQLVIMPMGGETQDRGTSAMGFGGLAMITGLMPGAPATDDGGMFGGGFPIGMIPLTQSDSPMAKLAGKAFLDMENGGGIDKLQSAFSGAKDPEVIAKAMAQESPTEKEIPVDPMLTREVELDKLPDPLSGFTQHGNDSQTDEKTDPTTIIAKAVGMPVLLESFKGLLPISLFVHAGKQPMYKILIGLEKAGYTWNLDDGVLRIRPNDWALRRSYEIPDSFIKYCLDLLETQGELTLDNLAYMASSLTDEQISHTLVTEEKLTMAVMSLSDYGANSKNILRFYATLSPGEKSALTSESGLPFRQLTNAQWDNLNDMLVDRIGGAYINGGSIRLNATPRSTEKAPPMAQTVFELTVSVGREETPRVIKETVMIMGKEQLASIKTAQKKALEAADKAAKDKDKIAEKAEPVSEDEQQD